MLTLVLPAAKQLYVTVTPPPGFLTPLCRGAVTPVGVGSILTRGAILAGIAVTLIDVNLAENTLMKKALRLMLLIKLSVRSINRVSLGKTVKSNYKSSTILCLGSQLPSTNTDNQAVLLSVRHLLSK